MGGNMVKIGYWNCRGLIGPIKLLLEYTGTPYEQYVPPCGPPPVFSRQVWMEQKHHLLDGYSFPNLPYYQDDKVKLTQFMAIMEYLGRKYDLWPEDDQLTEAAVMREYSRELVKTTFEYINYYGHRAKGIEPSVEEKRAKRIAFLQSSKTFLKDLSARYEKTPGCWMLGDKLTYLDFIYHEFIDYMLMLAPDVLDDYSNLKDFLKSFQSLPAIERYLKSDKFNRFPILAERSYIGREEGDWKDHQ